MSAYKTLAGTCLAIIGLISPIHAQDLSQCIVVAKKERVATYFSNLCSTPVHFQFEITGGTDYRGSSCQVGYRGGYSFSANYGPVNLLLTGCAIDYWVCSMSTWNRKGGSCR